MLGNVGLALAPNEVACVRLHLGEAPLKPGKLRVLVKYHQAHRNPGGVSELRHGGGDCCTGVGEKGAAEHAHLTSGLLSWV